MSDEKIVIYQVLPRLFSNMCDTCVPNGTYVQNGVGKLNHFTSKVLREIKKLGANYIWYTGVIEHATKTDYSKYGIRRIINMWLRVKPGRLMLSKTIMI